MDTETKDRNLVTPDGQLAEFAEKVMWELSAHTLPDESDPMETLARILRERNTPTPKRVCLCGSTRFYRQFQEANYRETMAGNIVLTVGFYPHNEDWQLNYGCHGEDVGITPEQKEALDELHKRKIDLCDEILVLNVGGYVGDSTRSEIRYAMQHGKGVRWLEPERATCDFDGVQGTEHGQEIAASNPA